MPKNLPLGRRDFLKLSALLSAYLLGQPVSTKVVPASFDIISSNRPGVIIIVLDALSALNLSLYGYPRKTSPNFERIARRSYVYHAHYSTANFTSSGTATLLTGVYPWTHRAFQYEGLIALSHIQNNIFNLMREVDYRLGYAQNPWADLLLTQFEQSIDQHVDLRAFNLDRAPFYDQLFNHDRIAAFKAVDSYVFELDPGLSASSLMALIRKIQLFAGKKTDDMLYVDQYPLGIPQTVNDISGRFLLEDIFHGMRDAILQLPKSSFAYFHLYPPHYPYAPRKEFAYAFQSGWQPVQKPLNHLSKLYKNESEAKIREERRLYDAYIASADECLGQLMDSLEAAGVLQNNYIVLTSDHGDIYERGVIGHTNSFLYEPLVRVPLLISCPGQVNRFDIHTPTSSVDILPTLLKLTNQPIPDACEGRILPGLGGFEDFERSIYSIDSKATAVHGQIKIATVSLRKGFYKLTGYFGYGGYDPGFELFDLQNDPEELTNLFPKQKNLAAAMREEMEEKLMEVNAPYQPG